MSRKILDGTTWYPAWQESRRQRKAAKGSRAEQPTATTKDPVAPSVNGTMPVAEVTAPTEPAAVAQPVVPARPLHGLSRGIRL